jgi:hypothetical protein
MGDDWGIPNPSGAPNDHGWCWVVVEEEGLSYWLLITLMTLTIKFYLFGFTIKQTIFDV